MRPIRQTDFGRTDLRAIRDSFDDRDGSHALRCRGTGGARNVVDDDGRRCQLAILLISATTICVANVAIVYFRMYAG
jgi:hypothetical protein